MTGHTTWIVQVNAQPPSQSPRLLREACAATRRKFFSLHIVPGSRTELVLDDVDLPVVFHGRTTLIKLAAESARWRSGVFFNPLTFQHSAYASGFGQLLLNADAQIMTWQELLALPATSKPKFIKPNDDFKGFVGQVAGSAEFANIFATMQKAALPVGLDTELVVSDAYEVDAEWRLFVVDGQIIGGSMYRPNVESFLPDELLTFAAKAVAKWQPAPVFVLDIGRVEGNWRIIECNCFNGSAFYAAHVPSIVEAVSLFQERI